MRVRWNGFEQLTHRRSSFFVTTVLLISSVAAVLLSQCVPAPVHASTSGLVAAFSFNEGSGTTVNDSSGNGNTGTISNATWTTAGKYGGALSFNGKTSRVT